MEKDGRRILLGLLFILIGSVLLLDNLRIIDFRIPYYLRRWEMIVIIIGVVNLLIQKYSTGVILILIGGIFWVTGEIPHVQIWDLWPLVFIIVGFGFILRKRTFGRGKKSRLAHSEDYFDDVVFFGGNDKAVSSNNFSGGKVTSVFGGSVIDLRESALQEGTTEIDIFTLFGGCELKVPENWHIKVKVDTVLGVFEDKRKIKPTSDHGRTLIIRGFTIFGGGEIKN